MNQSPTSDSHLILRLQARDQQAMGDLYDRYGRIVYTVILRLVHDPSAAEDLTQETFLKIWKGVASFDGQRGSLGAWITTVARNRALDYVRSPLGLMAKSAVPLETETLSKFSCNEEKRLIREDQMRVLERAFDHLNASQREVVNLCYVEGMSQSEAAKRLNRPLGTIKTWARTALQTLRLQMGQLVPDGLEPGMPRLRLG